LHFLDGLKMLNMLSHIYWPFALLHLKSMCSVHLRI
jgi:hypothetical protein